MTPVSGICVTDLNETTKKVQLQPFLKQKYKITSLVVKCVLILIFGMMTVATWKWHA